MFGIDFSKLFGRDRTCKDCQGRGRWQDSVETGGLVNVSTYYCETCHGRGYMVRDDDIDDFDLAGVGASEGDDE